MWRLYLIPVINGLKVAALGMVAVGAWFLAVWVTGGDFGPHLFGSYEPRGLSTEFFGLFFVFLALGVAVVTPLLWGWWKKGDRPSSFPDNPSGDGGI